MIIKISPPFCMPAGEAGGANVEATVYCGCFEAPGSTIAAVEEQFGAGFGFKELIDFFEIDSKLVLECPFSI